MKCAAHAVCATVVVAAVCLGLSAVAQAAPRDAAAKRKIDEAVRYLRANQYWHAEVLLLGTLRTCGDKCSPKVMARVWMYVGIIRSNTRQDPRSASQAFALALHAYPYVKFDTTLAKSEAKVLFVKQRARLAAAQGQASAKSGATRPSAAAQPSPLPLKAGPSNVARFPGPKEAAPSYVTEQPKPQPAPTEPDAATKPASEEPFPPYMDESPEARLESGELGLPPAADAAAASSQPAPDEPDLASVLMRPQPGQLEQADRPLEPSPLRDDSGERDAAGERESAAPEEKAFGEGGQIVFGASRLFGFYFWSASAADGGENPSGSSFALFSPSSTTGLQLPYNPFAAPYFGVDVFMADTFSVGGSLSYAWVGKDVGDASSSSLNAFGINGRLGFWARLGKIVGVWPHAGVTHFWASLGAGQVDYGYAFWSLTLELPLVITPAGGVGFTFGPLVDIPFAGARNERLSDNVASEARMSFFNWGVAAGLFGYL